MAEHILIANYFIIWPIQKPWNYGVTIVFDNKKVIYCSCTLSATTFTPIQQTVCECVFYLTTLSIGRLYSVGDIWKNHWIWSTSGVILIKLQYFKKNLSQCHFDHHKSHLEWPGDETWTSAVTCWQLTAWAMTQSSLHGKNDTNNEQSPSRPNFFPQIPFSQSCNVLDRYISPEPCSYAVLWGTSHDHRCQLSSRDAFVPASSQ